MSDSSEIEKKFYSDFMNAGVMLGHVVDTSCQEQDGPGPVALALAMAAWAGRIVGVGQSNLTEEDKDRIRDMIIQTYEANVAGAGVDVAMMAEMSGLKN